MLRYQSFLTQISTPKINLWELVSDNYQGIPPHTPGLYAVWWEGRNDHELTVNRHVRLKGKVVSKLDRQQDPELVAGEYVSREAEWQMPDEGAVCVYVGKASRIDQRLKQHIEYSKEPEDWYKNAYHRILGKKTVPFIPDRAEQFLVKRTSACQVRAGIEHMFKHSKLTLPEKLAQFSVSWVSENNFSERFYLEDLAIGYYRPWFNLDCER